MKAYVYLAEAWHVHTWVHGGTLPIKSVLTYKCDEDERGGNMTPDEGVLDHSTHDVKTLPISIGPGASVDIKIGKFIDYSNGRLERNIHIDVSPEPGIVLCAATSFDRDIAEGFTPKRKYCVEIQSIEKFKRVVDKKLGRKGEWRICEYTGTHNRNTFLKSEKDSWQKEVRIFWKGIEPREIQLPAGLAIQVDIT